MHFTIIRDVGLGRGRVRRLFIGAGAIVLILACSRLTIGGSTEVTPTAVQEEGSPAAYTTDSGSAITAEQAARYVQDHGIGGEISSSGQLMVEPAFCAPAVEIQRWIGTTEGRPDDAPLCLVQVRGQFSVVAPPGFDTPGPATAGSYAQVLFDGRTGMVVLQSCCVAASPKT
jgi:hypothetical protein